MLSTIFVLWRVLNWWDTCYHWLAYSTIIITSAIITNSTITIIITTYYYCYYYYYYSITFVEQSISKALVPYDKVCHLDIIGIRNYLAN